jgi:H+/Cl- antiporter ClcA
MLIGIILLKFMLNAIAISSPIPSGIFVPMFLIGGITGRLYGVLMYRWFNITRVVEFSVVGAACMVSSVTHTLAIAVIAFELVGEIYILYEVIDIYNLID